MYLFLSGCSAIFAYLTGWPHIMKSLGYSEFDIGRSFIPQTIAFLCGGTVQRYLMKKYDARKALIVLLCVLSCSILSMLICFYVFHIHNICIIDSFLWCCSCLLLRTILW